jgi:hypothetical protein
MPHKVYPAIKRMIVEKVNLKKLEIRNFEIDSVEMVELITMHTIEELKMSEGDFGNVHVAGNILKITDRKDVETSYKLPQYTEAKLPKLKSLSLHNVYPVSSLTLLPVSCITNLSLSLTDSDPYPLLASLPPHLPPSLSSLTLDLLPMSDIESFAFLLATTPCLRPLATSTTPLYLPTVFLTSPSDLTPTLALLTRNPHWSLGSLILPLAYQPSYYDFMHGPKTLNRHRQEWLTFQRGSALGQLHREAAKYRIEAK